MRADGAEPHELLDPSPSPPEPPPPAPAPLPAPAAERSGLHPLVLGAAAAAALSALFLLAEPPAPPAAASPASAVLAGPRGVDGLRAPCPPRTLPEGDVCVPLPRTDAAPSIPPGMAPRRQEETADHVPRRADRPADLAVYKLPLGGADAPVHLATGFDRDPAAGAADAHALELVARAGERVRVVTLDGQDGDAEILFAGELLGATVVTSHIVRHAGGDTRQYLVLLGRLGRIEPGIAMGALVGAADFIGQAAAGEQARVRLEVRFVRDGVVPEALDPKRLLDAAATIPVDPRNVLAMRREVIGP